MPITDYVYADVSDLEFLVGDLVTGRQFTTSSTPISLAVATASLNKGAAQLMGNIFPLKAAERAIIEVQTDYENLVIFENLKQANAYASSLILLDTFAQRANPNVAVLGGGKTGHDDRKANYKEKYKEFVHNAKNLLHLWSINTEAKRTQFFIGQDYNYLYRGINEDFQYASGGLRSGVIKSIGAL